MRYNISLWCDSKGTSHLLKCSSMDFSSRAASWKLLLFQGRFSTVYRSHQWCYSRSSGNNQVCSSNVRSFIAKQKRHSSYDFINVA